MDANTCLIAVCRREKKTCLLLQTFLIDSKWSSDDNGQFDLFVHCEMLEYCSELNGVASILKHNAMLCVHRALRPLGQRTKEWERTGNEAVLNLAAGFHYIFLEWSKMSYGKRTFHNFCRYR